ncbi:MAG: MarR family transcriptional regulator [Tissierellia bacterium]|nr:MarR family transcriptional regulator [Tissierellia bacterium]
MKREKPLYEIRTVNHMVSKMVTNYISKEFQVQGIDEIISPTQIQIIYYLMDNRHKEVLQKDLEMELNQSRASVSGVLKTMEKNELIAREYSFEDQRVKKLKLMQKGRDTYESLEKLMKVVEADIVNDIDPNDLQIFFDTIAKIKKNISNSKNNLSKGE